MMKYPLSHALVIRRYFNTLKNSCYADLQWAARRLKVSHLWQFKKGEVIATYLPTGQTILFRGADDPDSITSISVSFGGICWIWFEEAFQIEKEETFDKIDESVRAGFIDKEGNDIGLPEGYYKRIILTFNPWSERTWMKKRFFDVSHPDVLAFTTTFRINEWLLEEDKRRMEEMYIRNPRRARIACDGEWGIAEGLIFENFRIEAFDEYLLLNEVDEEYHYINDEKFGLDFGYAADPFAVLYFIVNAERKKIWVVDEIYKYECKNLTAVKEIHKKGWDDKFIIGDSAEPKSIDEMRAGIWDGNGRKYSLPLLKGAKKGRGSIQTGIAKIQDYEIIIHPRCTNFITEINNYCWDRDHKTDTIEDVPIDDFNHLMDCMRYAMEDVGKESFRFRPL
jgi:phage terminase large subunit